MKDFNYNSYLTYTFNRSIDEMNKILEIDRFQNYQINKDQKIIKYTINNSNSIKLSYLLRFIVKFSIFQELEYLKFSLAQMIQLGIDIYKKYINLKDLQIEHNYLSLDRIYLTVQNESYAFSILPKQLQYSIHFTGYDCPFYELENYESFKKNDEQSVIEIITHIIQTAKKQFRQKQQKIQLKYSDGSEKSSQKLQRLQIEEGIYQKIYNDGICRSLDQFIQNSNHVFQQFGNQNNQQQLLENIDLRFDEKIFWRNLRSKKVTENIIKLIQTSYSNLKWFKFEYLLLETIPLIVKELKQSYIYKFQNQAQITNFINLQFVIGCLNQEDINNLIDQSFQIAKIKYKFDMDRQIILQKTISQVHNRSELLNYFFNNVKFQIKSNEQLVKQIESQKLKILKQIVEENVKQQIELNFIKMLEEIF
ncbi:unnamed protein product [Paramecium pentaurelia]|uniref:Uncharacterized protein n=1 Tax=Paramecium pentaurelia TaxID=43138 RepID=A0A8S1VBG6_9CILI|nr:unnamed protein product [Paramecium pentaurelia]